MTTTGQLAGEGPAVQMDDDEERRIDERRLVEAFARHGAEKLAKRRHHGRWVEEHPDTLMENLADEFDELRDEVNWLVEPSKDRPVKSTSEARAECIDVALSAMILWDRLGWEGE